MTYSKQPNDKTTILLLTAAILIAAFVGYTHNNDRTLEVRYSGSRFQEPVPVEFNVPGGIDAESAWMLVPKSRGGTNSLPIQIRRNGDSAAFVTMIEPDEQTGHGARRYTLKEMDNPPEIPFSISDDGDKFMTVLENGEPVLAYVYGMNLKDGVPADRTRANYIHPIYGLDGEIITDDFPADHYHHRGLFVAWPQVIVESDTLDLWHINGIEKRFDRWLGRETGPVFARIGARCGWFVDDNKVASEDLWVTIFPKGKIGRTLDVDVTISAESLPLQLVGAKDPKGYGGFNFRPAPFGEPVISSNEGVQKDSDLRRFPWADFSAVFAGAGTRSGVAIFQNGDNINAPNGWCLRHYGFLGVSWPGNNQYLLQPGKPLHKRYRVWIHRGGAEEGLVSSAYETYVNPPRAVFVR